MLIARNISAELNEASRLEVIIDPSDNAYGIYRFSSDFLSATLHEPDEGTNSTSFKVGIVYAGPCQVSWRSAESIAALCLNSKMLEAGCLSINYRNETSILEIEYHIHIHHI